ncbi:MAG: hypothetical protein MJH10_12065 [Epibacterium sp.]|nr:hypothetical protein [Epibacterium sp.]NQX74282.1 hypothetical protein [Epibacterium sp.]
MDIKLIHFNFKLSANKIDSLADRDFLFSEVDEYLNKSAEFIVDSRYKQFEVNQKNIDSFGELLVSSSLTPTAVNSTTYYIDLPSDYRYFARVNGTANSCRNVKIKVIQLDDLTYTLDSNVIKPSFKWGRCVAAFEQDRLYFYTDGYTLSNVVLSYIKNPAVMSIGGYNDINGASKAVVQCDLPNHLHYDLIDVAVKMAQGVLENSFGYQVAAQLSDLNETSN